MEGTVKVYVYDFVKSINYGSGGFETEQGRLAIVGNNQNLRKNLLIHKCISDHGEEAYGNEERMECRDQDGGYSEYTLNEILELDKDGIKKMLPAFSVLDGFELLDKYKDHEMSGVNREENNYYKFQSVYDDLEYVTITDDFEWGYGKEKIGTENQIVADGMLKMDNQEKHGTIIHPNGKEGLFIFKGEVPRLKEIQKAIGGYIYGKAILIDHRLF